VKCKVCGRTDGTTWVELPRPGWFLCGPCWRDTGAKLGEP